MKNPKTGTELPDPLAIEQHNAIPFVAIEALMDGITDPWPGSDGTVRGRGTVFITPPVQAGGVMEWVRNRAFLLAAPNMLRRALYEIKGLRRQLLKAYRANGEIAWDWAKQQEYILLQTAKLERQREALGAITGFMDDKLAYCQKYDVGAGESHDAIGWSMAIAQDAVTYAPDPVWLREHPETITGWTRDAPE